MLTMETVKLKVVDRVPILYRGVTCVVYLLHYTTLGTTFILCYKLKMVTLCGQFCNHTHRWAMKYSTSSSCHDFLSLAGSLMQNLSCRLLWLRPPLMNFSTFPVWILLLESDDVMCLVKTLSCPNLCTNRSMHCLLKHSHLFPWPCLTSLQTIPLWNFILQQAKLVTSIQYFLSHVFPL